MASDHQNKMMRSRSAGRTTSKQSFTQPTLLERGFLDIYSVGAIFEAQVLKVIAASRIPLSQR